LTRITGIRSGKNKKRVEVYIDDELSLTVHKEVIHKKGLYKGQDITDKEVNSLRKSDLIQRCSDAALNFLSYRPRSETEVKQRLNRRGFDSDTIDSTIKYLKQKNFINDREFAQYWCNNRTDFNPKSRIVISKELINKGISEDIAREISGDIDELDAAYRAAAKKIKILSSLDYDTYRSKLYNYLRWRGFNYEIISNVCEQLWERSRNNK
jgi:regulatory protein